MFQDMLSSLIIDINNSMQLQMVRDYSLPAKTEFARGLEEQLAASLEFLWSVRPPAASQTNAIKSFRHQLTQLPNNVDEFDVSRYYLVVIKSYDLLASGGSLPCVIGDCQ